MEGCGSQPRPEPKTQCIICNLLRDHWLQVVRQRRASANRSIMESSKDLDYYLSWIPTEDLDQQIDYKHRNVRGQIIDRDLGKIADNMPNWEGNIATAALELPQPDIIGISRGQNQGNIGMQK